MASTNITGNIDLSSSNGMSILVASPEFLIPEGRYTMPVNYCFDINITSSDAVGNVKIFIQNDDPTTSTFVVDPKLTFPVTGGKFINNQTKQVIDSNSFTSNRFVYVLWTRTSGSGTIGLDGQITRNG
jgi:hypothetical protein